ncbi:hypothetical protein IF1G_05696 [Cordyceps javanica]|uniref:Uncharacterized protein n=1 Tax=Cordyceps javanica TaxID=43265 RepID=A0A545V2E0_9HYPO|nr:hypothetical protein IF1G_05696 [Cordyceps javanica]
MDSSISLQVIEAARNNFTVAKGDFEHFLRCWAQQDCGRCINTAECSWCPYVCFAYTTHPSTSTRRQQDSCMIRSSIRKCISWACVPNKHEPAFLAPVYHEDVCPAAAERWELRSRPFGCHASTYTVLSTAVAVNATLLAVLLLWLLTLALRHVRRRSRAASRHRYAATWWTAVPPPDGGQRGGGGETQPLLVDR